MSYNEESEKNIFPPSLQGILWSKDLKNLDIEADKTYIIHQILSHGNLQNIRWLFKKYSWQEIIKVFINSPQKIYQPSVYNFIKIFILGLRNAPLHKEKYVKTIF